MVLAPSFFILVKILFSDVVFGSMGSGVSDSDGHATPSPWSHWQLEQQTSIHGGIAQNDAMGLRVLAVEGERSPISRCSIPDSEWDTTGVAHGWWQVRVSRK